jgi:hypothetical protein
MKIVKVEDRVQLGERGYIRHKIVDMPEGELIQKCILCGQIIKDYRPSEGYGAVIWFDEEGKKIENYVEKGMPSGYIYVSEQKNPYICIHEILSNIGAKMPDNFIDCTTLNS